MNRIELINGKCQQLIDSNEIFVDGDKDAFLARFVEPYLKSNNLQGKRETINLNSHDIKSVKEFFPPVGVQIEVFHYFPKSKTKASAIFEPSSGKIIYAGVVYNRPSAAAIKATIDNTGKNTSLNGWTFWKYIDTNGNTKTIENLK